MILTTEPSINSAHLSYLRPLLKWRILDVQNLMAESELKSSNHNFYRVIRQLQKKNVLAGFRDPFSKKKYVFLTERGEAVLSLKEHPTAISSSTIVHDLRVSEISRMMLQKGWVRNILLEHELLNKKEFSHTAKINPDALFEGELNDRKFRIAFELELTRKSKARIEQKALHYVESGYYDYAMYMFSQKSLADCYQDIILSKIGSEGLNKFMFFYNESLTSADWMKVDPEGCFRGKSTTISKLFCSTR